MSTAHVHDLAGTPAAGAWPVLAGKVAIVTGASSGIGHAAARLFARAGACVVAGARRRSELDALVAEIAAGGGRAVALAGDVRDESFAEALVALAVGEYGGLDVAFNNAGTPGALGATIEVSRAGWDETIATNLTGAFLAAKQQIAAMLERGGGSLIFTSSFVGHTAGMPGMAAYAASKAGLIGLTQALATELGPRGIRVNAILPGATETAGYYETMPTADQQAFARNLPALKRIAAPDEIAQSALYLASDASTFTTGAALLVDGGISINRT